MASFKGDSVWLKGLKECEEVKKVQEDERKPISLQLCRVGRNWKRGQKRTRSGKPKKISTEEINKGVERARKALEDRNSQAEKRKRCDDYTPDEQKLIDEMFAQLEKTAKEGIEKMKSKKSRFCVV